VEVQVAAAPIDIALITLDPAPAVTSPLSSLPSSRPRTAPRAPAQIGASRAAASAEVARPATEPTSAPAVDTRSPQLPALPDPRRVATAIAEHDAPTAPPEPPAPGAAPKPKSRVEQAGRAFAIHDRVVDVHVEADGTAHMHDRPDGEVHFALPILSPRDLGKMISKWYEDPYARTRVGRPQDQPAHEQAVEGGWDSGSSDIAAQTGKTDGGGRSGGTVPIIGGSFDITAWAMRKFKAGDPYSSRKRALLDTTFDQRVAIGASHRSAELARAGELIERNLASVWGSTPDPAARRAALFALWDECAEGDGATGEAGERARAQVIGFIRAHLPAGAPGAFSVDDIAAFDAHRTSHAHFAPY